MMSGVVCQGCDQPISVVRDEQGASVSECGLDGAGLCCVAGTDGVTRCELCGTVHRRNAAIRAQHQVARSRVEAVERTTTALLSEPLTIEAAHRWFTALLEIGVLYSVREEDVVDWRGHISHSVLSHDNEHVQVSVFLLDEAERLRTAMSSLREFFSTTGLYRVAFEALRSFVEPRGLR